jgi:hypothetical protein
VLGKEIGASLLVGHQTVCVDVVANRQVRLVEAGDVRSKCLLQMPELTGLRWDPDASHVVIEPIRLRPRAHLPRADTLTQDLSLVPHKSLDFCERTARNEVGDIAKPLGATGSDRAEIGRLSRPSGSYYSTLRRQRG